MGNNNFIHLRTQSSYSMLESALSIDGLIDLAIRNKMNAVALTDRGNLFGSLEFSLSAAKAKLQPIHGAILNLLYLESDKPHSNNFAEILLIAKDEMGFANLLKLVSSTFTKNDRRICNHITLDDLKNHQEGIIALSCYTEGVTGKLLLENDQELAVVWSKKLKELFGDRFYFEIMRHNLEKERQIEERYIDIAGELDIPLVATNNVLFKDIHAHDDHDVLLCISAGVTREYPQRKRVSNQCYFKSPKEMSELFADLPEAVRNTVFVAQRCYVMAESRAPMLPSFESDVSEEELLRKTALEGLNNKLEAKFKYEQSSQGEREKIRERYVARLNFELDVICSMNFNGYFLIVSDFIKWSKKNGITVGPGRGSGAGSMVAWCLLITDLDPIKFGLLFERFLNPDRVSMPDFDIDFCQERREDVINYVRSKYGVDRVGQIITFGKLQAKAVIKDVARVLSLPYKYAETLTELVPFNAVNPVTLSQAIKEVAELKGAAAGKGLYDLKGEEDLIKQVLKTALALEGLHRHASIHAAGIVIAGKDLVDVVPVYKDANSEMLIVQYSMKYAEAAGLMKFDFLGLQTLTVITKCKELLKEQAIDVDFDNISFDDEKTYEMLSTGAGTGVFQFESVGMKDTLRKLRPDCVGDLIALGALYRPGPMENIPTYIACKNGLQEPEYLHPLLKPILEETYGVIIYQEQVMEIARTLAGYSLAAADLLRRAMGKKIKSEMDAQEELFVSGATKLGVSESQAKSIFTTVEKFAGYGFNKAHAAAYAVISYQTAYLKANFLPEFLTTCLNLELNNNDKINLFIQEGRNNDIPIIPPDINLSSGLFTILPHSVIASELKAKRGNPAYAPGKMDCHVGSDEPPRNDERSISPGKSIIYALGAIKNVTVAFGDAVAAERKVRGDFKNITDFIERIHPKLINKRLIENLIRAGCFDKICDNQYKILANIPTFIAYSNSYHQEQNSSQFSLIAVKRVVSELLLENEAEEPDEFDQFNVLGLFLNNHPLEEYKDLFEQYNLKNSSDLRQSFKKGSSHIRIAGIIQKKDARMSSRGRFITIQLSDPYGIFDLTIYSEEVLKEYVHLLNVKTAVIATCDVYSDDGGIRLTARKFTAAEDLVKESSLVLNLLVKNHSEMCQIIDLLSNYGNISGGNTNITILLKAFSSNFLAKIELPGSFNLNIESLNFLRNFQYEQ
jgi:DNA polymerase III subunit alpha